MRRHLILAAGLIVSLAALWLLLPREALDRHISFDSKGLGEDPEVWLQLREQEYLDLEPGTNKRILWAGQKGAKTPYALVYIHGFSATAAELRPVPDEIAKSLGANLYFTRLQGHGRGSAALAEANADAWVEDLAEAMAIGRMIGDRVILMGTSMGGALAVIAATDPKLSEGLGGVVLVSPALAPRHDWGWLLDAPFARSWAPLVMGNSYKVPEINADHARYWTTEIPTSALFQMAKVMRAAREVDFRRADVPLLVLTSPEDRVFDPRALTPMIVDWGGDTRVIERHMTSDDDPNAHVIAGDVFSPGQNEAVIEIVLDWIHRP